MWNIVIESRDLEHEGLGEDSREEDACYVGGRRMQITY
jgi:hypothetical protein